MWITESKKDLNKAIIRSYSTQVLSGRAWARTYPVPLYSPPSVNFLAFIIWLSHLEYNLLSLKVNETNKVSKIYIHKLISVLKTKNIYIKKKIINNYLIKKIYNI